MEGVPTIERGPERLPTKEEVLEVIGRFAEGGHITAEFSDAQGLYVLELEVEGEKPGEIIEYGYLRKGASPGHKDAAQTAIHRTYYQDGVPVGGHKVAYFDGEEWQTVE